MTTSEFLQVQAELLTTVVGLRKMPLEEFAARAREIGGDELLDARGHRVAVDGTRIAEVAAAAIEFRDRVARRGMGAAAAPTVAVRRRA